MLSIDRAATLGAPRIFPPPLVALDAGATVAEAATLMAERRIGSVAIRERGEVVGLVTERDLVVAVLARGGDSCQPVRDVMRRDLPRVGAGASDEACAALMRDHATRHLLLEERGDVVAVVSMRDVIQRMLDEKQYLVEQLRTYIDGR